jgi:hypothetical protein
MEPKSHRCDLYYKDSLVDLQTAVLSASPQDWQLDQCSIDRQAAAVLKLTKPFQGLTFQFLLEQPGTASELQLTRHHTLQVLEPSPEPGEPPVTVLRQANPWTTDLASRIQCMMFENKSPESQTRL